MEPGASTHSSLPHALQAEWSKLRITRGAVAGFVIAALAMVSFATLAANFIVVEGPNGPPIVPLGPDGDAVTDRFYFLHQPLVGDGGITARVAPLTGIITYPPPDHDEIVKGVVPWAKAGVMIKENTRQGSCYAAMMLTGSRGVRMQYNFSQDIAGSIDAAWAKAPVWLRLLRTGEVLRGYESTDGAKWSEVGAADLAGLPARVQIGLFVTSPGDVTLHQGASRFTQATAVFDQVSVEGNAAGVWNRTNIGHDGTLTDWERFSRPPGATESAGTFTVTGSGDIAPGFDGPHLGFLLVGTIPGLFAVLLAGVLFAASDERHGFDRPQALTSRTLTAKALVIGLTGVVVGLAASLVAIWPGKAILQTRQVPFAPLDAFSGLRIVVGTGALFGLCAVLALSIGVLLRRRVAAMLVAIAVVVLPYILAIGVLAGGAAQWDLRLSVSQWLLRLTPSAALAVQQVAPEYPQMIGPYTAAMGYFPLSALAGLGVLGGYAAVAFGLAAAVRCRRTASRAG